MSSSASKSSGKRYVPLSAASEALEATVLKDMQKHPLSGSQSPEDKNTGSDSSNLHADHKVHKIHSDYDELKPSMSSSADSSAMIPSSEKCTKRIPYKRCSAGRYLIDLVYQAKPGLCDRSSHACDDESGSRSDSASEPKLASPRRFFADISIGGSEKSSKCSKAPAVPTRVLRSATRGQVTHFNEKKKKCHLCRERMEDFKLTRCINYAKCHGAFCTPCLEKHFKSKLKKERVKRTADQWVCFLCRGLCQCPRCQDDLRNDLIALQCGAEIPDLKDSYANDSSGIYLQEMNNIK